MVTRAHLSSQAKQHLDRFSHSCRIHPHYIHTDRQTDRKTDRHADRPCHNVLSVAIGYIYAMHTMWTKTEVVVVVVYWNHFQVIFCYWKFLRVQTCTYKCIHWQNIHTCTLGYSWKLWRGSKLLYCTNSRWWHCIKVCKICKCFLCINTIYRVL